MPAFLLPLVPTLTNLAGLLALSVVAAGLLALGGLTTGPRRRREADLVFGWAVVSTIFTLAGTVGISAFASIAAILGLSALAGAAVIVRRDGGLGPHGIVRVLILAAPLILLVTAMTPTQWDELTHWLPNARYLFEHDTFPRAGLPANPSSHAAYPYGVPLIIFLASCATGFLAENTAGIFNLLLYLFFGLFVARLVASAVTADDSDFDAPGAVKRIHMGWGLCAFAGLVVTALNPTFVSRLVFSSYADAPTTITIGFAGAFTWMMLNALSRGDEAGARALAWQSSLALTAALSLKQANLIFLIALVLAAGIVALRDPAIRWRSLLRLSPHALALPLIAYGLWRLYVGLHFSGGEFSFLPYADWLLASIPDIVARMALIASKKGGYFGVMTVATVIALYAVWHPRTAFHRLAIVTAVMFVTYNGFLLTTYVTAFGAGEGLRAASYWRYNTHLGGVCLVFAACGAALLWRRFIRRPMPRAAGALAMVLVLALPLAMGKKLRFDDHPRYGYAYATAEAIAKRLSTKDRLLLVDRSNDGQYLVIMRYRMHGSAAVIGEISASSRATPEDIRDRAIREGASHLWVYDAGPAFTRAFGPSLPAGASHLLARRAEGWTVVESWPHPGPTSGRAAQER